MPDQRLPHIHELFAQVREHPDFAFGAIFVAEDFSGGRIPEDFSGRVEENLLAQYGSELLDGAYGPSDETFCEECGATTQPTYESAPGPSHDPSCSLNPEGAEPCPRSTAP